MDELKDILIECETLYNEAQLNSDSEQLKHIKFYLSDKGLLTGRVSQFKREGAKSLTPMMTRNVD